MTFDEMMIRVGEAVTWESVGEIPHGVVEAIEDADTLLDELIASADLALAYCEDGARLSTVRDNRPLGISGRLRRAIKAAKGSRYSQVQ